MDDVENKEELDTSTDSSTDKNEGTDDKEIKEEMVPKSVMLQRLKEVKEGTEERVKKELSQTDGQEKKPPVDEGRQQEKAKLRETISEIEADKEAEEKKIKEDFDKKLDDLKVIDPSLDEKALLDIVEKYSLTSLDAAFKIYNDLQKGEAPEIKPKLPKGEKTTDDTKQEEFEPSKAKSAFDAVQEGLKRFGIK